MNILLATFRGDLASLRRYDHMCKEAHNHWNCAVHTKNVNYNDK